MDQEANRLIQIVLLRILRGKVDTSSMKWLSAVLVGHDEQVAKGR